MLRLEGAWRYVRHGGNPGYHRLRRRAVLRFRSQDGTRQAHGLAGGDHPQDTSGRRDRDGNPGPQHYLLGLRKDGTVASAGIDFAALYGDAVSLFDNPSADSSGAVLQQSESGSVDAMPEEPDLLPIGTVYSDSGEFELEPGWSDQPIPYSYAMPQVAGIFADSDRLNAEIRALLFGYNYVSSGPDNTHILHTPDLEIPFSDYLPYETTNDSDRSFPSGSASGITDMGNGWSPRPFTAGAWIWIAAG
mgnify:CR=1 FL=1